MDLVYLITLTIGVSVSGALSPGPLTFSAIVEGSHGSWFSGLKEAIGHASFELPFVVGLTLLLQQIKYIFEMSSVKIILGLILLSFLLYFSYMIIKDGISLISNKKENFNNKDPEPANPIITGFVLTATNPLFLSWWITVGLILIITSTSFGFLKGISIMYASHVWMDFMWLSLMAFLGSSSKKILNNKNFGIFLIIIAITMLYFGISTIIQLKMI